MAEEEELRQPKRVAVPWFVKFMSSLLQRVAEENDRSSLTRKRMGLRQRITAFHGLTRPSITIDSYLERIFTYANCSPCCYVVAYIYLDRFAHCHGPLLPIDSFTVHRLLITSVLVAAKFMDDVCYNNAYFAKVGGIGTVEMNLLERDFLFGLNFRLNVSPASFESYCNHLQNEMYAEFPASALNFHCLALSDASSDETTSGQQQQKHEVAV